MNTFNWLMMRQFNFGGVFEEPLNRVNFRKTDAMQLLTEKFSWQYYGGKHYESVFTKLYQAYILPTKFGIDKRKMHLSSLIRNNEISRESALVELEKPLYEATDLRRDKKFVLKKLGFTESEFSQIMTDSPIPHDFYPTDRTYILPLIKFGKLVTKNKI